MKRQTVIMILTIAIGLTGMTIDRIKAHATKRFNIAGPAAGKEVKKVNRLKEKALEHNRFAVLLDDVYQRSQLKEDFGGETELSPAENALPDGTFSQAKGSVHQGCLWVAADGGAEFRDIQSAVDAAYDGDSICVVKGTYKGKKDFILTWKKKNLKVLGGFSSVGSIQDSLGESIIDGEGQRRCVLTKGLPEGSEFSGFTLTRCDASREPKRFGRGSAMMNIDSRLTIRNAAFKNNKTKEFAAAVYNFRSDIKMLKSTFDSNYNRSGATVVNVQSDMDMNKCLFVNNTSDRKVSALMNVWSGLRITNSVFSNNKTASADSMKSASAIFLFNSPAEIVNASFYGNGLLQPKAKGSAILISNTKEISAVEITNSILRDGGNEIIKTILKGKDPVVRYSNIQGGFPGTANIDSDPLFKDAANMNFELLAGSQSIDSGIFEGSPSDDFLGMSRPSGSGVDMGAYETMVSNGASVVSVSAGGFHTCVLLKDGITVHCWGSNENDDGMPAGQGEDYTPANPDLKVLKVSSGREYNCFLLSDGNVECRGDNTFGQTDYHNPFNLKVTDIAAGDMHACAILEDGYAICWGSNEDEYGNFVGQSTNYDPGNSSAKALKIASGGFHNCVLLDTGTVYCWGSNTDVIPSVSNQSASYTPSDPNVHVVDISAGEYHSCALLNTGSVHCWGSNNDMSSLGISNQAQDYVPTNASLAAVKMTSGGFHNCALLANGTTHCWGWNILGQANQFIPSNPALKVTDLEAGFLNTCFVLSNGSTECQGWNAFGQSNSYVP